MYFSCTVSNNIRLFIKMLAVFPSQRTLNLKRHLIVFRHIQNKDVAVIQVLM